MATSRALLALVLLSACDKAADSPDAKQLIDASLAAKWGTHPHSALLRLLGSVSDASGKHAILVTQHIPDRYAFKMDTGGSSVEVCWTKDRATTTLTEQKKVDEMDAAGRKEIGDELLRDPDYLLTKEGHGLPPATIDGKLYDAVAIGQSNVYFDQQTHLVRRVVTINIQEDYTDYRDVNGVKVAYKFTQANTAKPADPGEHFEYAFDNVLLDPKLDDDPFPCAQPATKK